MAKIRNSKPKQSSGGYQRLVGDKQMAEIFTKAQSTVISNGSELEKIIASKSKEIEDLDQFIENFENGIKENGTFIVTKKKLKKSKYKLDKHEPDFLIFKVDIKHNMCYVVELKDGDTFDTKKSLSEKEMLKLFVNHIAPLIPFKTKYYICAFNQIDREKIVAGFKNVFNIDEVITGEEFCNILEIDYKAIVNSRENDTTDNFNYIVEKMSEIDEIKEKILNRNHINDKDFYEDDEV